MKINDIGEGFMGRRCIVGVVICLVGIALILFSIHAMHRISSAKGSISTVEGWVPKSVYKDVGSGVLGKESSQYDVKVRIALIGGIILALAGGVYAIRNRKRK